MYSKIKRFLVITILSIVAFIFFGLFRLVDGLCSFIVLVALAYWL